MRLFLLATALCACQVLCAQSIVKPLPKVAAPMGMFFDAHALVISQPDSTMNAWRPITNIAAYSYPGNILMAGAGIGYQHLQWVASSQKWNCLWSVNGVMWAGGSVAPSTPAQAISFGIMGGFFNNLIMIGPALNGSKVQAVVSVGINLNN